MTSSKAFPLNTKLDHPVFLCIIRTKFRQKKKTQAGECLTPSQTSIGLKLIKAFQ